MLEKLIFWIVIFKLALAADQISQAV